MRTPWHNARRRLHAWQRDWLRPVNALLAAMISWVVLGSSPSTAAYLTATFSDPGNAIATAKQFTVSDVAANAQPGGTIQVSWSVASWAAGGYSIRRATSGSGPFTEQTVAPAGTTSYTDSLAANGATYWYAVFGLSGAGGMGTGSTVASATADGAAPLVTSSTPAAGATDITLNSQITVNFSEAMNAAPTGASLALLDCAASATCASGTTPVSGAVRWPSTSSLTFAPTHALDANTDYAIQLTSAATDLTGNALACTGASVQNGSTCWWIFQTGSTSGAPGLASATPADGATGVPTNAVLHFRWSAGLNGTGQTDAQTGFSLQQVSGTGAACYVFADNGQTPLCAQNGGTWTNPYSDSSRLTLSNPLLGNTSYTAAEVANDAGNLVVNWSATWTTGASTDSTPPTVSQLAPANGTSGVSPSALVEVTFSEAMAPDATAHAFEVRAWSDAGACTGSLGSDVAGAIAWSSASKLVFHPSSDLSAGTCYHVSIGSGATDTSENPLSYAGADFTVLGGTPPTVTLGSGAYYYPGGIVTASGSGWSSGTGNVVPHWDDGSALDATGAALSSNAFSSYTFSLPANAANGAHRLDFVRSSGATISVPITVQSPSALSLSAALTDIAAGDSSAITATVYDGGQLAANALVTFAITTDAGSRGSLSVPSAVSNGSGLASTTLNVSNGGPFTQITITATSGSISKTITIIDPAPLPPSGVHASASDKLEVSWLASPSPASAVAGYEVLIGAAAGKYDRTVDAGAALNWVDPNPVPGQTYYIAVRAVGPHGARSEATPEVRVTAPALVATRIALMGTSPAAGAESTLVSATVFDQYNRPMPAAVTWTVAPGFSVAAAPGGSPAAALGSARASAAGSGSDPLTTSVSVSRQDASLGMVTLRAVSGTASTTLDLTFAVAATPTATATATGTATATAWATPTPTVAATATVVEATATPRQGTPVAGTPTLGGTSAATPTPTVMGTLATVAPSAVATTWPGAPVVASATPGPSATGTPTPQATTTPTPVASGTAVPTATAAAATSTAVASGTPAATGTPGASPTVVPSTTPAATATSAATPTAAATATSAPTATQAPTATHVPPTATTAPTATHVPATNTPVPATATPTH